jgi:2-isopropylmalate synthase
MTRRIEIYDTTLRDGAQGEGISFSGPGKLKVAKRLDEFGVDYIEGGYAASNPKDMEFFHAIREGAAEAREGRRLRQHAAGERGGGGGRRNPGPAGCEHPVCTIFGKSWRLHVHEVLRTTEDENRAMIADTVRFLKQHGREVIYDAEHFFDGSRTTAHTPCPPCAPPTRPAPIGWCCATPTAARCRPRSPRWFARSSRRFPAAKIGIHTHNDSELGVANSLAAIEAGAMHVQGTINGFGERVGNANLVSIIPNLALKLGYACMQPESLKQLKGVSQFVNEMANQRPNSKQAFVGDSAFAHKAGMHVDGVRKLASSFEHINPELVGNQRRILISELSGASNVFLKAVEMGLDLDKNSPEVKQILHELEGLEKRGYAFEAAEASFKMLIQKVLKKHKPFFTLHGFRVIVEKRSHRDTPISEATVKLDVGGQVTLTVGEGDGPVDALNVALRNALSTFYPSIKDVQLVDYNVRILDPETATAAKTRVLIESTDGQRTWGTVGVSTNLIEASWEALVDSVEYKLFLEEQHKRA